jgi:hypothetical protein
MNGNFQMKRIEHVCTLVFLNRKGGRLFVMRLWKLGSALTLLELIDF